MNKQVVKINVLPEKAANRQAVCTLADSNVASIAATAGGVEVTGKHRGTTELTVATKQGEVTKKIPINVGETTTLSVDSEIATGSMSVKDVPEMTGITNLLYNSNTAVTSVAGQYAFRTFLSVDDGSRFFKSLERDVEYTLTARFAGTATSEVRVYLQTPPAYNFTKIIGSLGGQMETKSITFTIPASLDQGQGFIIDVYDMAKTGGCKFEWATLTKGKTAMTKHIPAMEDYGVVHGQPNLVNESTQFTGTKWAVYQGSAVTVTPNIKDGELSSMPCSRIVSTGGTHILKYFKTLAGMNEFVGTHTVSFRLRNNASTPMRIWINGFGSNPEVKCPANSVTNVSLTDDVVPGVYPHIQFRTESANQNLDITVAPYKVIRSGAKAMDSWTLSQADFNKIYTNKTNLLPMANFVGMSDLTTFNRNWTIEGAVDLKHELVSDGVKFQTQLANRRMYNVTGTNWDKHKIGQSYTSLVEVTMPKGATIGFGQYNSIYEQYTARYTGKHLIKWFYIPVESTAVSMFFGKANVPYIVHRVKICEGDSPAQFTPVTDYLEQAKLPFTAVQYGNLATPEGVVRAETLQVGRGAETRFDFRVLEAVEKVIPNLFTGMTTAQKIAKLTASIPALKLIHTSRGAGVPLNDISTPNFSKPYIRMYAGGGVNGWAGIVSSYNDTNAFKTITAVVPTGWIRQISTDGLYTFSIASKHNGNADGGTVSDGVTSAWVEVKDIKLEITIQPPADPNAKPITITVSPS